MLTKRDLQAIDDLIKNRITPVENKVSVIEKDIKSLKRGQAKLRREQKTIVTLLDGEQMALRRRVKKLEDVITN